MKKKTPRKLAVGKEIVLKLTLKPELLRMVHKPNTSTYDETCLGRISDMVCIEPAAPARKAKKK